jgi:hypothetical protein
MQNSETNSANSANQPADEKPGTLECSGAELVALLASLRARGAIVLGMTSICVSRWRLSIEWPIDRQTRP